MKYAVCNETFDGWDHARACDAAAAAGYTGLEIAPFTLAPLITDVTAEQRREIRRTAERAGLQILGLHWLLAKTTGFHLTTADAGIRKLTGEYFADLAHAAADLGGTILVLGSPKQRNIEPGLTHDQAAANAADTLSHCLKTLEDTGVVIALEPLAPSETDFLNTAVSAVELMRRVGHPNLKLHLDVKAMSSEARPVPDLIRQFAPQTAHFHANDANLRGPGFGAVDFVPIFKALKDTSYAGWVSVEVFDYTPDPVTIAVESLKYMKRCEESA